MTIPFTQYLRPDGRTKKGGFDRPDKVEQLATAILEHGGAFEIEVLLTGDVHMTCAYSGEDVVGELCENGPELPKTVDRLVKRAAKALGVKAPKS